MNHDKKVELLNELNTLLGSILDLFSMKHDLSGIDQFDILENALTLALMHVYVCAMPDKYDQEIVDKAICSIVKTLKIRFREFYQRHSPTH